MRPKTGLLYATIVVVAVVLDYFIKQFVEEHMVLGEPIDILPFFALYRAHNPGIAFSMFADFGPAALIALTLVVIVFVSWLALKTEAHQTLARIGFALIIGGAIGNLIDRVSLGYVIDYFLFHTPVWSFAIFNLADVFITFGAGFVVLQEIVSWRRDRTASRQD